MVSLSKLEELMMRILIVGASGTIGQVLVKAFKKLDYDVIEASKSSKNCPVDITCSQSIETLYQKVGSVDAVICAAAKSIVYKPLIQLSYEDFQAGLVAKYLSQLNLVLIGQHYVNSDASFTLTSGILNHEYIPMGTVAAGVNNAIEGFVQSASLELPKKMRLNCVSPNLLKESADKYKDAFMGFNPISSDKVANAYIRSVCGVINGKILKAWA